MRHLLLGLAAAAVIVSPVNAAEMKQTVWWRTDGAAVIGFDHDHCSLFLYRADSAFVFTWFASWSVLEVETRQRDHPQGGAVPAAVQIGETWLGQPQQPGALNLQASGGGALLTIPLHSPVEPLLAQARQVTLRLADTEQQLTVPHDRMPELLKAADQCRKFLR